MVNEQLQTNFFLLIHLFKTLHHKVNILYYHNTCIYL